MDNDILKFIKSEAGGYLSLYYDVETKVMYAMSCGYQNYGHLTVLLNPDGTPKLYKEK